MKKQILTLIPSIFLVSSCSCTFRCAHLDTQEPRHYCDHCGEKISDCLDEDGDGFCDICGDVLGIPDIDIEECAEGDDVCKAEQVTGKIKPNPAYPLYLKVGESLVLDAAETNPKEQKQRSFTFSNLSPDYLDFEDNPDQTKYPDRGTVTGKKATKSIYSNDNAKIKATNDYTPAIESWFNFRVIDFDPEEMYLWQYGGSNDRKQFYNSETGLYVGNDSGTAKLGNLNWEYDRGTAHSLGTSCGGISFGKNTLPEDIDFINRNIRPIKSITIEHGSAKGLANLTVSVGETDVKTVKCPYASYDTLTLSKIDCENLKGDIKLHFESPEYDVEEALEDPDYDVPGAIYLKSIFIEYASEEVTGISIDENSQHQTVFAKWDDFKIADLEKTLVVNKTTESGDIPIQFESLEIEEPDFTVNPDSPKEVKIKFTSGEQTFETSYEIFKAASLKYDEEASELEVKDYLESATFKPRGLVVWGYNADKTYRSNIANKLRWIDPNTVTDSDKDGSTYLNLGTEQVKGYIKGKLDLGNVLVDINPVHEITKIELDSKEHTPTVKDYVEGGKFKTTGLKVLGYGDDSLGMDPVTVTSKMNWYDGASYDAEPQVLKETLSIGTTYVVGKFRALDTEIRININAVKPVEGVRVTGSLIQSVYFDGDTISAKGLTVLQTEGADPVEKDITSKIKWYTQESVLVGEPTKVVTPETTAIVGVLEGTSLVTEPIAIKVVEIEGIYLAEGSVPSVTKYTENANFDATGLTIMGHIKDAEDNLEDVDVTNSIKVAWLNGYEYDKASEKAKLDTTQILSVETTSVYGVCKDHPEWGQIHIEGLQVLPIVSVEYTGKLDEKKAKDVYAPGKTFSYASFEVLGHSQDDEAAPVNVASKFDYYDAVSYETDGPSTAAKSLQLGTTEVVGVLKSNTELTVRIPIKVREYTKIELSGQPTTVEYAAKAPFDPTGLKVTATLGENEATEDVSAEVVWYDGATYVAGSDSNKKFLQEGTTSVVGEFNGFNVTFTGITVIKNDITLTQVTSVEDLTEDGKYLIVSTACNRVLDLHGTSSGLYNKEVDIEEYNSSIDIPLNFEESLFDLALVAGEPTRYHFSMEADKKVKHIAVGLSGITTTMNEENDNYKLSISFNNGIATISGTYTNGKGETSSPMYLNISLDKTTGEFKGFKFNASNNGAFMIYKLNVAE